MGDPEYFKRPHIVNNPILAIIIKSTDGLTVKAAYEKYGSLEKITRSLLGRVIIDEEENKRVAEARENYGVTYLTEFSITPECFTRWSILIAALFAGESCLVYYTPYRREGNKKIPPTGILHEHWCYKLKRLIASGVLRPPRRRQNIVLEEAVRPLLSGQQTTARDWLKTHSSPNDSVRTNWTISRPAREELLIEGCTIAEYFELFPCLKNSLGAELLSSDFQELQGPGRSQIFFSRWELVRDRIGTLLGNHRSLDPAHRATIEFPATLATRGQDTILLYFLPYLITPPQQKRKLGEKVPKVSYQEKLNGFILHVETADEIFPSLEHQRRLLSTAHLSLQPLVVIVGPLASPERVYVYVNDSIDRPTIYESDTILSGIDLTFKIFFALRCAYPTRASCVWQFIQRGFYDIQLPTDKFSRPTEVLLGQVKNWTTVQDENIVPN